MTKVGGMLIFLNQENPLKDLFLFIHSKGGSIRDAIVIYNLITELPADVNTVALGTCASSASLILIGGTFTKRSAFPHARIMIHEVKIDEPESDESEIDEPEIDEPEIDEPEIDEPEIDEPEIDKRKIYKRKIKKRKIKKPKIKKPKIKKPKIKKPKIKKPKIDKPDEYPYLTRKKKKKTKTKPEREREREREREPKPEPEPEPEKKKKKSIYQFINELYYIECIQEMILDIYIKRSGKTLWPILQDLRTNVYMSAEEAKSHGIVDSIATKELVEQMQKGMGMGEGESEESQNLEEEEES